MTSHRRVAPLTRDTLGELPSPCRTCARWELDVVHRERAQLTDRTLEAKQTWLSGTLLEWGSCGQIVYSEGTAAGYILYAPPAYLGGLAAYPTAPIAADAVALATLRVEPEFAGHGLARLLIQIMAADLVRRGVRAVEAIATTSPQPCLVPADLLLALGFTTVRAHPRTPRLRLDLRSTVSWRDEVVELARERFWGRRRPVGAASREEPG